MNRLRIIIPTLLFPILMLLVVVAAVYSSRPPSGPMIMREIASRPESPNQITIVLEPTLEAVADRIYNVEVDQGKVYRALSSVSWTMSEIQAKQTKGFRFPMTPDEFQTYTLDRNQGGSAWKNLSDRFTVLNWVGDIRETSSQIVAYSPASPSSFNWWFVWGPLVGIILLVVYMRILVSYLKEARERRKKDKEAKRKEAERRVIAAKEEEERRLIAIREEELGPFLKSKQRLWQCINCENAMTDEQRMKYGVCPTCKGDRWVKTHIDQQILDFVNEEFAIYEPLPSDINIEDVETRLGRNIKRGKEAKRRFITAMKEEEIRRQTHLLEEQGDLLREQSEETRMLRMVEEEQLRELREQSEETRKLRMVEEEKLAEEQLRELRERNRYD